MGKRKERQKFIYRHTLLQEEIEMSTRERKRGRDNGEEEEEEESIFTAAMRISGNGNKILHRMRDKSIQGKLWGDRHRTVSYKQTIF